MYSLSLVEDRERSKPRKLIKVSLILITSWVLIHRYLSVNLVPTWVVLNLPKLCIEHARHHFACRGMAYTPLVLGMGRDIFQSNIIVFTGVPWTEEEHRLFLLGLQKLGKGDWRGISRDYVPSRTPTQVASHAQKYFIRQSNATRRKRRSSLFDMVPEVIHIPFVLTHILMGNIVYN